MDSVFMETVLGD